MLKDDDIGAFLKEQQLLKYATITHKEVCTAYNDETLSYRSLCVSAIFDLSTKEQIIARKKMLHTSLRCA